MSQEVLADWLGISRALLAQVEIGKRDLPVNALIRFTKFKQLLASLQPTKKIEFSSPIVFPKKSRETKRQIQKLENEISNLQFNLESVEKKMETWSRAIELSKFLLADETVQPDKLLEDAIERFLEKQYIFWAENGPGERQVILFYLNQKKDELAFTIPLEKSYSPGTLPD